MCGRDARHFVWKECRAYCVERRYMAFYIEGGVGYFVWKGVLGILCRRGVGYFVWKGCRAFSLGGV